MAKNHHHKHLIPLNLSRGKLQTRLSDCYHMSTATYQGWAGRRGNCSRGHLPALALLRQFSSRSNGHHQRQQRIFFFTLNSLNGRPFTEEQLVAPMLFYNKGPTGRGYTNPAFFPSNNRFHSCFQRSWPVCCISAMLTHPARVPWSV